MTTPPSPSRGTDLATIAYRLLTVALAALAVTGQIAYLDVLYWNALGLGRLAQGGLHPALLSSVVTGAVVTAIASAVGLTMAFRGDGARGARPLGLAFAAWGYLLAYSGITVLLAPDPTSMLRTAFDTHFLVVEALGSAALLRFTSLFPTPLRPSDLEDPDALVVGLRTAQRIRQWLLGPAAPWLAGLAATGLVLLVNRALGRPAQDAALLLLTDLFRLTALAIVILNMRRAFLVGGLDERRLIFWFVVGFTLLVGAVGVLLGGNLLTGVTRWTPPSFNWRPLVLDLGVVGLVWGAAMGVFYRGAMRPGKVARRLAVALSALTLALFLSAGLESLLAGGVATRVSLPRGIGTLVASLSVALLYMRTRRPIESLIYNAWSSEADRGDLS